MRILKYFLMSHDELCGYTFVCASNTLISIHAPVNADALALAALFLIFWDFF